MASFLSQMTKRKKNPDQIVKLALRALHDSTHDTSTSSLSAPSESKPLTPNQEELCKRLSQMKTLLYGENDKVDIDEDKATDLSHHIQSEGLILHLIDKLKVIPFEARKDTALVFNNLIRKNICDFSIYVNDHYDAIVRKLVNGYDNTEIALNCGAMIRECIRHDPLARRLLCSDQLWLFFESYVHQPNFDIASDAFNTLRDLLMHGSSPSVPASNSTSNMSTTQAPSKRPSSNSLSADLGSVSTGVSPIATSAAEFLETNFDEIFKKYEVLLQSENYVTKRRSLKLLGELLLDRRNFSVMMRFISNRHYLKVIMMILRDKSPSIQFEAFHVFKVFVANPKKPSAISAILYKNREKLVNYLSNFLTDKEDVQFNDEKRLLIDTLLALQKPEDIDEESESTRSMRRYSTEDSIDSNMPSSDNDSTSRLSDKLSVKLSSARIS